jgi:hypothetical protein
MRLNKPFDAVKLRADVDAHLAARGGPARAPGGAA